MKKLLAVLPLALVLFIGAALGGVIDLGGASQLLSRAASHLLERELRIDGELELRLGLKPRMVARGVTLANPPWTAGELLRIGHLELTLDLPSLWRDGPVRIERLRIEDASLALIEREDGSTNWFLGEETDSAEDPSGLQLPVLIIDGMISDSVVRYFGPDLHSPAELHIERMATSLDAADLLQLQLRGKVGELPLKASGQAGSYAALLSGEHLGIGLQLELGRYRLVLDGTLGNLARLEDFEVEGRLTGPDSKALYDALHFSQSDSGPVDLNLAVGALAPGVSWSVQGRFGSLVVDVDGSMTAPLQVDGLASTVAIAGNNLDLVAGWLDIHTLPPEPFQLEGNIARDGPLLQLQGVKLQVGDALMHANAIVPNFPGTRDIRVDAGIEGASLARFRKVLGLKGMIDAPFDLDLVIADKPEGLDLLDSTLQVGDTQMKLSGPIGEYPGFQGSELRFELEGASLAALLAELDIDHGPALPYRGTGLIRTRSANRLQIEDAQLGVGGLTVNLEGELDDLTRLKDNDLHLRVTTASLGNSMRQFGQRGLPELPASLAARLYGPLATPTLENLELRVDDATLMIEGRLRGFPTLDGSEASLRGEIPGPAEWLPEPLRQGLVVSSSLRGADRQLWLEDLTVESPHWQIDGSMHLNDLARGLGTVRLSMQGAQLARLLPPVPRFQPATSPFELRADLERVRQGFKVNSFQLQSGRNQLDLDGALSDRADAALTVNMRGNSLASLGKLDGAALPDQAYSLRGTVARSGSLWSVDDLALRLGEEELTGTLRAHRLQRPHYEARLRSPHFNLGQFLPAITEPASQVRGPQPAAGALLIPDRPLPLAWMGSLDAELDLDLAGLNVRDNRFPELIAVDRLRLDATLDSGELTFRQLQLTGDRGTLSLPATLRWRDDMLDVDAALLSEQIKLSLLSPGYDSQGLPVQRIRSRFRARGGSPHQLAASLSGYLLVESGPGKLVNSEMDRLFDSFINQLLNDINPFLREDEFTKLKCGVVGIQFYDGKALLDPGAIFRTSRMDIMATGEVQLATEALELHIINRARKGLGFSTGSLVTPFLQVGGTLADPRLEIDTEGATIAGGTAAATLGLSVVASTLWNRYMNQSNPCQAAAKKAQSLLEAIGAGQAGRADKS